jgi:hypothetical protein
MRGLVAVARREIAENRMVFVVALIAGMGPVAVPIVRNLHNASAVEIRSLAAFFGAVALAAGLSIALGFSTLSQGISNRRIGFFFDRPLSSLTIWAGKLTGVAALALAAALIATLPTLLVNGGNLQMPFGWSLWLFLALALLLIPVSHALSVLLRSRSVLIGADFLVFGLVALVGALAARPLVRAHAVIALRWGLIGVAVIVWLGVLTAGYRAVARGRTDIRAAHRALSPVLWSAVLGGALLFSGYTAWLLAATPADLQGAWGSFSSQGRYAVLSGELRHRFDYRPHFLVDLRGGRSLKIHPTQIAFSRAAEKMVWIDERDRELYRLDLASPAWIPVPTRIVLSSKWGTLALSPDGERVAIVEESSGTRSISAYELSTGRLLAAGSLPEKRNVRLCFVGPDRVLAYAGTLRAPTEPAPVAIWEVDIPTRRIGRVGELDAFRRSSVWLRVSPAGDRLLANDRSTHAVTLADARTGHSLASFAPAPEIVKRNPQFLSDGGFVLAEVLEKSDARLRLFDRDGRELRTIALPHAFAAVAADEVAPRKLVVLCRDRETSNWTTQTVLLVNLDTAEVREVARGLLPVNVWTSWIGDDPGRFSPPGSDATKLFYGANLGSLVYFDPLTGKRQALLSLRRP